MSGIAQTDMKTLSVENSGFRPDNAHCGRPTLFIYIHVYVQSFEGDTKKLFNPIETSRVSATAVYTQLYCYRLMRVAG